MLTKQAPVIKNDDTDKVQFSLLLPSNIDRKQEGGLRVKGSFKCGKESRRLVSIVTIVFNGEKYLEETIKSVLGQSYENLEYIIIDGGSSDGTIEIIKKYESQIDYWISESDKGIADAFNKGVSLCAGDIVGIINSDDWYEMDAVEKVVACSRQPAVFCGNVQYWDGYEKDYVFSTNIPDLQREMTVNHPAVFVSKSIYSEHGVFDVSYIYAMDYELLLRFYKQGVEFIAIDDVLSNMRLAGVSDANWVRSFKGVRLAKIQHGESYVAAYGYFIKQLVRKNIAYLLSFIGLESIVMAYRRKHSIIKKQKS